MWRETGKIGSIIPMPSDSARKNISLTRYAIERATQQERLLYGHLFADLRKERGVTQEAVAERSGVTSRTIRNIETGEVAGQADKLIRLFIALDIDLDGTLWSADVHRYTSMLAPLIHGIHPEHRLEVVGEIIPILTRAVTAHPNASVGGVDHPGDLPTLAERREQRLRTTERKAAKRGKNEADIPHAD